MGTQRHFMGRARKVLEEAGGRIYFEPGNADALVSAMDEFYRDAGQRRLLGPDARKYIVENL